MAPDFDQANLSNLKTYFARPENWAARNFSLSKNSFVLFDTSSLRLVLYKGPIEFSGKLKNIGPLRLRLLRGELQLQVLPFITHTVSKGTARGYSASGAAQALNVSVDEHQQFDHWTALDFSASADAIWLMEFTKAPQFATCVTFDANSASPERVSLLYHSHSRLFNYIEVLARSACDRSLAALLKLAESSLDELAWRAIEGLHHRSPAIAAGQFQQFAATHASEVVRNRCAALIRQNAV
jgi:hypothetical protein